MQDDLGDRMKGYEAEQKFFLPPKTYTIIRADGKGFHSYTRDCEKPFDSHLALAMDFAMGSTAETICADFAYTQSDEISFLLTDFSSPQQEALFGGNIQKLASITCSMITAAFNRARRAQAERGEVENYRDALFDARCFTLPTDIETENYFIWRQKDAYRNSVSMLARAYFSHKQLHGKSSSEMLQMLLEDHGVRYEEMPGRFRRGATAYRKKLIEDIEYFDKHTQSTVIKEDVERWKYMVDLDGFDFLKERERLSDFIKKQEAKV